MTSLRNNLKKLRRLQKAAVGERKRLLKNADNELVQCICDCAHNCINNNVPLTNAQFTKLAKHKRTLRRLCKPGESWKQKKKVILQSGGFLLPLLVPILASVLGGLLA